MIANIDKRCDFYTNGEFSYDKQNPNKTSILFCPLSYLILSSLLPYFVLSPTSFCPLSYLILSALLPYFVLSPTLFCPLSYLILSSLLPYFVLSPTLFCPFSYLILSSLLPHFVLSPTSFPSFLLALYLLKYFPPFFVFRLTKIVL